MKIISSIGIMVLSIGTVVGYDLVFKDKALSTEVVVAKKTIERHSEFSRSNLVVERRSKDELIEGFIKPENMSELYGKDSNVKVLENQLVSTEYVDTVNITPDPRKNEAIRPIPSDWIYAMPGSLRRKDIITIYPVKNQEQKETNEVSTVSSADNKDKEVPKDVADNASPEEVASRFQPILEHVAVSYVKTSANQEVVTEEGEERLNASGQASDIEINISDEDLQTIVGYIDQGYKLYISYR